MTGTVDEAQRLVIFKRDHWKCVTCGTGAGLTYAHRVPVGMGGSKLILPPSAGVTQCYPHNQASDTSDGQATAFRMGWKLRSAAARSQFLFPFYDESTGLWWMPDLDGGRFPMSDATARATIATINEL